MKRFPRLLPLLLLIALIPAGCGGTGGAGGGGGAPLAGTAWKVTAFAGGKGGMVAPIAGSEVTVAFSEDGTVSGFSGVNTYSGSYELAGEKMTIGPLATTLMASEDPALMEQEAAYLAALRLVTSFSNRGSRLELLRADGSPAVFCEVVP